MITNSEYITNICDPTWDTRIPHGVKYKYEMSPEAMSKLQKQNHNGIIRFRFVSDAACLRMLKDIGDFWTSNNPYSIYQPLERR